MSTTHIARPAAGLPRPYHFPEFLRRRIAGGLDVITAPVRKLPLVSVVALVDAGAMRDPAGREGLAVLTAKMLLEGTRERDGAVLADAFERLGATVDVSAGWDAAALHLTVLRGNADAAMRLLSEVVRDPGFRERDLARLKAERVAQRMQMRTEPRELADESFERFLYDSTSRYARPDAGSARTVNALTHDDVLNFYHAHYVPARTTLIIVGDLDHEAGATMAEETFGGWAGSPGAPSAAPTRAAAPERRVQIVAKTDAPQSELRIGHVGVPRSHPDHFPLVVMNAVLGGLFTSRINLNLRERHGYAYGARSAFEWRRGMGPFVVSTAVESGVTADATREVVAEIEAFRKAPITDEELSLATSYLEGIFPIRYETTAAIASALTALVTYDLPADYFDTYRRKIAAVSSGDVLRVANEHLHPEQLLILAVGDPTVIEAPLARLKLGTIAVAPAEEIEPGT